MVFRGSLLMNRVTNIGHHARSSISGHGPGQPSLNPLAVQFFSSLEGLEIVTSGDRQLIRGHNLVGAVRLQFAGPGFFEDERGEHREVLGC
jgi:hypothetical protein